MRLYAYQGIALALFASVVGLAVFGVFGESAAMVEGRRGALAVRVDHPARFRDQQTDALRVRVTNASNQSLDSVDVAFDPAYIDRFDDVSFTPSARDAFVVRLQDVRPGETRLVDVRLRASDYGRHRGDVVVTTRRTDSVRLAVSTFVFP